MQNDPKSSTRSYERKPLIGSHQTPSRAPAEINLDSNNSYCETWEYSVKQERARKRSFGDSIENAYVQQLQTDAASVAALSASSRATTIDSEGGLSNASRAVSGAGCQFDHDHPPKYGPTDPDPWRNCAMISLPSSRSNTDIVEKDPSRSTTEARSDAAQSEKFLAATNNVRQAQSMSREQTMAGRVVVTMIIATVISTAMAVSKEMQEPIKKVDFLILLGTSMTATLAAVLVLLWRGPFEHIVGGVLICVAFGILFAVLF